MTMVFWGLIIFVPVMFCSKIEFVGAYRIDILSSTNLKKILIENRKLLEMPFYKFLYLFILGQYYQSRKDLH